MVARGPEGNVRPLVSVGVPTYNRPGELARSVRSVLAQDHADLEVVISDDASLDPVVQRVGLELAAADPRVRFHRQPRNLGHALNYQWVLEAARGTYFMWLSDDDWIDPNYVSSCLRDLRAEPNLRIVAGSARYYRDGRHVVDERPINLESARAGARIVRYFARVSVNGPLFGVARRSDLLASGFPDVVGGDWLLVSRLAARGPIRTLCDVHVHRSLTGLGSDGATLARSFGLSGIAARQHHMLMAVGLWHDVVHRDSTYRRLHGFARASTATLAAALILMRFPGLALLRLVLERVGATQVEDRVMAWMRAREQHRPQGGRSS